MLLHLPFLLIAIALLIPCAMLLVECLSAVLGTYTTTHKAIAPPVPHDDFAVAVLMPAHNEADVIVETLVALTPQLAPHGPTDRCGRQLHR